MNFKWIEKSKDIQKTLAVVWTEPGPPEQNKLVKHIGAKPLGPTEYSRQERATLCATNKFLEAKVSVLNHIPF